MDTQPEAQPSPELLAHQRRAQGLALARHTSLPPTRKQLLGELKCRLLERRALTTEIEALNNHLRALPA